MVNGNPHREFTRGLFDRSALFDKPEPLNGVRVLEVCSVVLGPAACDYLAEFGAETAETFTEGGGDRGRGHGIGARWKESTRENRARGERRKGMPGG